MGLKCALGNIIHQKAYIIMSPFINPYLMIMAVTTLYSRLTGELQMLQFTLLYNCNL